MKCTNWRVAGAIAEQYIGSTTRFIHDRVIENINNISAIWKTLKIQVKLILNRQKAIITNYTNYSDYTN
mgnify:CR=1 FL=1